ncbi:MAG TPA: thioredoxin [Chitinophagaceae bacterium]|nr:thioredoxin [Chitinophagaceae bacterium]
MKIPPAFFYTFDFQFHNMHKVILMSLMVLFTHSCSNAQQEAQTKSVIEYFQLLGSNRDKLIIDVRTPQEFADGHLANAININYNSADFEEQLDKLPKNKPIFIYCLSGGRSGSALQSFSKKGFKTVYNMQGGILQWKAKNYPLAGSDPNAQSWTGMTKEAFNQLIHGDLPVLIDFKAAWCGPCKAIKPIMDEIQQEYGDKVKVVFIDIDENKSLADDLKIRSIPLLIYYVKGKPKANIEGMSDKKSILEAIGLL